MDIFSCSLNQPNYKSPRVPLSTDPRTEDTDLKKFPSANATSTSATRIFNSIVKEAGTLSKEQSTNQAQTSKILKSLMNRSHHPDSNRKPEKTNRPPQFNKNGNEFDDPSLRGYEEDPGNDYENHRLSNTQKLPIINHKKQLPRIEANKKLDRLNTLEKHLGSLISPKCENDLLSSQNRVTTQPHSPSPSKQLKGIWKSPLKNGSEEREYYIDVRNGKVKESASKTGENGNVSGQTVVVRTRFSSGGKMLHNNLSGGEEEEGNQDKVGLSLMISSMKGSQRAGQHIKKRTEMWRQVRASSPEIKENSIDIAELKKVKMKIEQQKNGGKSMAKKKNQDRASSVVYTSGNMGGEINGRNDGGWEKDESEGSDNEEDNFEEKKVEEERNREKNVKRVQQAAKDVKSDTVTAVVSKQAKKLQDHIQISRVGDKEKETAQMKREQAYKEFILRLNFSFNVQVRIPTEKTFTSYKYFLGKGNNSMLIKALMKQRWWWVQVDNKEPSEVNFMWTQLKQNKFIGALKQRRKSPFDNLEWSGLSSSQFNDNNTTSSTPTFIDSLTDCESDTTEGESKVPIKKAKKSQTSKVGKGSAKKEGNDMNGGLRTQEDTYKRLFTNSEISLMNSVTEGKSFYPEDCEEIGKVRKGPSHQVIGDPSVMRMCNHLESNFHLANKKALLWNMKSYYEAIKKNVFDYLPLTFHVRNGFEDPEYQKFVEYYNNREKEIQEQEKLAQESKEGKKNAKKLRNIWIVKPGENTNRGVGIHVCDSLSQINDLVATTEGTDGKRRTYLIQQYLDRPLLYNKRKFDIRCYILMTCINGMMKGYWYQDGYIRTASKEFSLKNVTNKFVHLTNDAIQKKAEDYGKFESGNKVSYNEFQKYLDTHHDGSIDFSNEIYPQIKQLATDAIKGVYGKIDPHRRENSFEVFGLDFMIDTNLRAWLIEVNTNPDINASSPVLTRVIPPMVENALRLTIDQMYPPPAWHSSKKQMLPENMLENNKFELVFDEVEDGPALRSILQADKGATGDLILEIVAEEEEEEDAEEEIKD